nr:MAG TPA: hypothetical protein [Caudoviricetes sp.]
MWRSVKRNLLLLAWAMLPCSMVNVWWLLLTL